jgi:ApaG protein
MDSGDCNRARLEGAALFGCNSGMQQTRYEITVEARSAFVPEQSDEGENRYVFAYTITIRNTGTIAAKLVSRHWVITDSDNQVQ